MKLEMMKKKYNELMKKQINLGYVLLTGTKAEQAARREQWNCNNERLRRMKKRLDEIEMENEPYEVFKKDPTMNFMYGMKCRGFSPACQPMDGLVKRVDDYKDDRYYDVLIYSRPLDKKELVNYELEYCGCTH
ncbi:MAG: hypothetical protein ACI4W2_07415 [Eubacterium sp.]